MTVKRCPSLQNLLTLFENESIQKIKYQDIIYYKFDRDETIESDDSIYIDFFKAMSEMERLDWTFQRNYIGFHNKRKEELVQFIRIDKNKWYADIPIDRKKHWDRYYWASLSDNKTVASMMRLFFEEMPWFGMLEWKMKRYKQIC